MIIITFKPFTTEDPLCLEMAITKLRSSHDENVFFVKSCTEYETHTIVPMACGRQALLEIEKLEFSLWSIL